MNQDLWLTEGSRLSVRDRILTMRSKPMFEGLDDDGLLLLAEHGHTGFYRDGEVIAPEGEPARQVYLIEHGEIVVSQAGQWVTTRKEGDAYGGLPLLAREPSPLAVAKGDTRTLEVPGPAFEAALTENFSLLRNTLKQLGASVLQHRGNLPADPDRPRTFPEGPYYEEPRTLVERLIQLRGQPFGRMNLDALVDMARHMIDIRFPAGTLLWSIGEPSTHALNIDYGSVRCTGPDGRHVMIGRGFTLGVLDVWSRSRVYEVRTETPVIAYRIEFESFLALLEKHPEVGLELLRGFARDLLSAHAER
ncbi:MAG: cyclic nucleotide-binding domain-containing protein [Polyangiaceae bacterium]